MKNNGYGGCFLFLIVTWIIGLVMIFLAFNHPWIAFLICLYFIAIYGLSRE